MGMGNISIVIRYRCGHKSRQSVSWDRMGYCREYSRYIDCPMCETEQRVEDIIAQNEARRKAKAEAEAERKANHDNDTARLQDDPGRYTDKPKCG